MNTTTMLTDIPVIDIWAIVKLGYLLFIGVYIAFATIVIRQIYLMTNTLYGGWNIPLKLLGYVHLFAALGIFFLAWNIL